MKHIKRIKIDIDKKNFKVIPSVQFDNARFLHINLVNGSMLFDLTGCSVKISGTKPDGTIIFNNCTIINEKEGFIEVELTEQINAVPGIVKCELKLYDGNGVLTTKNFDIEVSASATANGITSSNEFKALTDALKVVQGIDNKADKEKVEEKFGEVYEQLEHKANYDTVWNMTNMGQDVKEAMTGGSVAVVGKNSVLTENIVDRQVTRCKTNFYSISKNGNLIDRDAIIKGKYIDNAGTEKNENNETDFIPIDIAKTYRFNFNSFITFWDDNREFISGYIQGSASHTSPVDLENVPSDAKYVRLSVFDEDLNECVFSEKSLFSNQLPTKYEDNNVIIKKEQIKDFKIETKDFTNKLDRDVFDFYSYSDFSNLFIPSLVKEGGFYTNSGVWSESNNHVSTHLIAINPSKKYKHNIYSFISFWNENEEFISGYIEGSGGVNSPQILREVPPTAKYVRFSVELNNISKTVVSLEEVFRLDLGYKYIDNDLILGENNLEKSLIQKINSSSTTIAGKTINFLGDSITYGFDGTNSTRVTKPYPTLVGEILGAKANNYGISGSTIGGDGKTATEHNILGNSPMNIRYVDMDDADYVLVLGGVNDYTVDRRIPLGVKGDNTNLTFYGALKILIEGLIAKYPNSRIGFITPLRKFNDHNPNVYGNHLKEYRNAIIEMCEEYSIPVLDLFTKGGCYANISDWRSQNLPDGLHPNQSFYEKMAIQISSFIESI